MPVKITIVIPTYQERNNIRNLLTQLRAALTGLDWNIIFVDDNSPDGTANLIRSEGQQDPRIHCIERVNRRGLSSACIEGLTQASAPFCAIMDADLQHDPSILPQMIDIITKEHLDIVIASRYVPNGKIKSWSTSRFLISTAARWLTQKITRIKVEDPLSGFFLLRKDFFNQTALQLNKTGYKILLDLLLSSPLKPRIKEIPYTFQIREHGRSKLNIYVVLSYFHLIIHKGFYQHKKAI